MIKKLILGDVQIHYTLEYKKIKNINLRIKNDGAIYVSVPERLSESIVEKFLVSKSEFILKAIEKYKTIKNKPIVKYYDEEEIKEVILSLCKNTYPYFKEKGVNFPEIRFRKMTSRWGSCIPSKGILTFNINLMYAPLECIDYVIKHEYTHFLQPNHQKEFYTELSKVCPGWKECRDKLKNMNIKSN